jgi:hypothetical protein
LNELDLLIAIRDTSDSASSHFMNFVSGLFAVVLASHFVGTRLSRTNLGILIALFTAFTLTTGYATVSRLHMVNILLEQLASIPDPKLPLPFSFAAAWGPAAIAALLILGYVGGLVFLFESRRAATSEAESPEA